MRPSLTLMNIAALMAFSTLAEAEIIGGVNYADDVATHSAHIQNYSETLLSTETTWWLTGPPDADSTHDFVAGWRAATPDEYVIMKWNEGIPDLPGDDLSIRLYAGSAKASADVFTSLDGNTFTLLGVINGRSEYGQGDFFNATFDFAGHYSGKVHYVKVLRKTIGNGTGMFFDAFGGMSVPEPSGCAMTFSALAALAALRMRKRLQII